MRRIPHPSRALDPLTPASSSLRQCARQPPSPYAPLRASSAAFSTSPSLRFLLPGKQDKKKHQQFVRRWQKRLLGESEPIGAHVDPYDPTSPVRIAPEEQGEYEEVLDEDRPGRRRDQLPLYTPAHQGLGLQRVGGEQWLRHKLEGDMAKEFEKLTLRTYTPLTLDMANEIEELTGTPYTLRDENLMMAQTVHQVTGRPYTHFDFGFYGKVSSPQELRIRFARAVAEVFTLSQAGLDMDLSKLPNRGVYEPPRWVREIKFITGENGKYALAFPKFKSAEQFLQVLQSAPEWELALTPEADHHTEELVDSLDPNTVLEQPPIMDPATPAFKRQAVLKMDPDNKPFDFMSNRPVPRAKPLEQAKVAEAVNPVVPLGSSRLVELASAIEMSRSTISEIRHSFLEQRTGSLAESILALRRGTASQTVRPPITPITQSEEIKWRRVPINELDVKFALFKRLFQLTGLQVPDPQITSANTLGDLYGILCAAAKPQPASLFSSIHVEGQKAREQAKRRIALNVTSKRKADLGDLINLGNVRLQRVKPNKTDKRTKTGLEKVVQYALWERGLTSGRPRNSTNVKNRGFKSVQRTKKIPEFGKPMSSKGANFLAKKTREWNTEQARQGRLSRSSSAS